MPTQAIAKVPSVVQKRVARDKAQRNLARQRALSQRGAGTPQEQDDAENEVRTAVANYDEAIQTARTVIASADRDQGRARPGRANPQRHDHPGTRCPSCCPPASTGPASSCYGVTKRQVSEGQMIKEGEAVAELVIEDPIRLWCQVPEQYEGVVQSGQRVRV